MPPLCSTSVCELSGLPSIGAISLPIILSQMDHGWCQQGALECESVQALERRVAREVRRPTVRHAVFEQLRVGGVLCIPARL
jgi:hypothetical protein